MYVLLAYIDKALLSEEENLLIINRLHQVLRPFVLRRLKHKVPKICFLLINNICIWNVFFFLGFICVCVALKSGFLYACNVFIYEYVRIQACMSMVFWNSFLCIHLCILVKEIVLLPYNF